MVSNLQTGAGLPPLLQTVFNDVLHKKSQKVQDSVGILLAIIIYNCYPRVEFFGDQVLQQNWALF